MIPHIAIAGIVLGVACLVIVPVIIKEIRDSLEDERIRKEREGRPMAVRSSSISQASATASGVARNTNGEMRRRRGLDKVCILCCFPFVPSETFIYLT